MAFLSMLLMDAALCASSAEIVSPNLSNQLYLIWLRIELLTTTLLQEKCPHLLKHDKFIDKREVGGHAGFPVERNLSIEMRIFNHLQELLEQCNDYLTSATADTPTTTTPITTTTAESATTTTPIIDGKCVFLNTIFWVMALWCWLHTYLFIYICIHTWFYTCLLRSMYKNNLVASSL